MVYNLIVRDRSCSRCCVCMLRCSSVGEQLLAIIGAWRGCHAPESRKQEPNCWCIVVSNGNFVCSFLFLLTHVANTLADEVWLIALSKAISKTTSVRYGVPSITHHTSHPTSIRVHIVPYNMKFALLSPMFLIKNREKKYAARNLVDIGDLEDLFLCCIFHTNVHKTVIANTGKYRKIILVLS